MPIKKIGQRHFVVSCNITLHNDGSRVIKCAWEEDAISTEEATEMYQRHFVARHEPKMAKKRAVYDRKNSLRNMEPKTWVRIRVRSVSG